MTEPTPRIHYFSGWQDGFIQLARPIGFYVCLIVLTVNGLAPPIGSALGHTIQSADAATLAVIATPLLAWVLARSWDKQRGTTL